MVSTWISPVHCTNPWGSVHEVIPEKRREGLDGNEDRLGRAQGHPRVSGVTGAAPRALGRGGCI